MRSPAAYNVLPGCGFAAYALLLLAFFIIGASALIFWTASVLNLGANPPSQLIYGGLVPEQQLAPMRAVGVLKADEVPDVFSAEVFDGTQGCAIASDHLIRLGPEGAHRIPLSSLRTVEAGANEVRITADVTVSCGFYQTSDAERFARILQAKP